MNSRATARLELGLELGYKEKNAQSRIYQYEKELNTRSEITYRPSDSDSFPEPSPKNKLYTGIWFSNFDHFIVEQFFSKHWTTTSLLKPNIVCRIINVAILEGERR